MIFTAFLPPLPIPSARSASLFVPRKRLHRSPSVYRVGLRAGLACPPPLDTPPTVQTSSFSPPLTRNPIAWDYICPRLLLLAISAVWGTNFGTLKVLQLPPDPLPIPVLSFLRFSFATVFLIPPALFEQRNSLASPSLYFSGIFIGLLLTLGYLSQNVSLVSTSAATSAFLCSLVVVLTPVLERVLSCANFFPSLPDRPAYVVWGSPILAILGVALIEGPNLNSLSMGDAFAALQAVFFAGGFIFNKHAMQEHPKHAITLSAVQLGTAAAAFGMWNLCSGADLGSGWMNGSNLGGLLYTGVVSTALTVWLENVVLEKVSAGELAVIMSTEPLFAAVWGSLTLGESFGGWGWLGGFVILTACLVGEADKMSRRATLNRLQRGFGGVQNKLLKRF